MACALTLLEKPSAFDPSSFCRHLHHTHTHSRGDLDATLHGQQCSVSVHDYLARLGYLREVGFTWADKETRPNQTRPESNSQLRVLTVEGGGSTSLLFHNC